MADDHELVRHGVIATLERAGGFQVVAQAENGEQALQLCAAMQPDVLVVDLNMPVVSGLEILEKLPIVAPSTRAAVLSMDGSDEAVQAALAAGARAYVLKSDAARDVVAAVTAILEGRSFFTARIAQAMLSSFVNERREETRPERSALTHRETQIVCAIAQGKTNREMAADLGISVRTIETHRSNILEKLGAHSVSEIVMYAIKAGLCDPNGDSRPPDRRGPGTIASGRPSRGSLSNLKS